VVTASGVHDPESPGGAQGEKATLGDLKGLERDGINFDMVDGNEFNADKAYKDSKVSIKDFLRPFSAMCVSNRFCFLFSFATFSLQENYRNDLMHLLLQKASLQTVSILV
jgi:hypothetical protein